MPFSHSHLRFSVRAFLASVLVLAWSHSRLEEGSPAPAPIAEGPEATEQLWIVESIVRETVRMADYAAAPGRTERDESLISVSLASAADRHYIYAVSVQRPGEGTARESLLQMDGGVWNPASYVPLVRQTLASRHLQAHSGATAGEDALSLLTVPRIEVLQHVNANLSERLRRAPLDPAVHEGAALLLGTLGMRENAGAFGDARPVCNRLAAHLAFAAALRKGGHPSLNGRVAHLLGGLLAEAKQPCEDEIAALSARAASTPALRPWLVAAKLRNRSDWRLVHGQVPATLLERVELFRALCGAAGTEVACATLARSSFEDLPDWPRILLQAPYGAAEARRFVPYALTFELEEVVKVFPELAHVAPRSEQFAEVLNRESPGTIAENGTVRVIDDGLWGQFLQRHLCHVISQTDHHFGQLRGFREHATAFRESVATIFGRLQLFPAVAAMSEDAAWQKESAPALASLAQDHPERVTETVWARFVAQSGAEGAGGAEEMASWFSPALPAGTAYRFDRRAAALPALKTLAGPELAELYRIAPWHLGVAERYVVSLAPARPSAAQYETVLGRFLPFHHAAWERFPELVRDNPETYAATLSRLAQLDPELYATLGTYLARHHQEDQAALAYLEIVQRRVGGAAFTHGMDWLADYYLDRSRQTEALAVGKLAVETGSSAGLQTMARIQERLENRSGAEKLYEQLEDLYDDPSPLAHFYGRQLTLAPEYAEKLQAAVARVFPEGITPAVETANATPPERGVAVSRASADVRAAGLFPDDVVVAVNGQQTGTLAQYAYLRGEHDADSPLDLVIYREGEYRELHVAENAAPPLSDFATYHR